MPTFIPFDIKSALRNSGLPDNAYDPQQGPFALRCLSANILNKVNYANGCLKNDGREQQQKLPSFAELRAKLYQASYNSNEVAIEVIHKEKKSRELARRKATATIISKPDFWENLRSNPLAKSNSAINSALELLEKNSKHYINFTADALHQSQQALCYLQDYCDDAENELQQLWLDKISEQARRYFPTIVSNELSSREIFKRIYKDYLKDLREKINQELGFLAQAMLLRLKLAIAKSDIAYDDLIFDICLQLSELGFLKEGDGTQHVSAAPDRTLTPGHLPIFCLHIVAHGDFNALHHLSWFKPPVDLGIVFELIKFTKSDYCPVPKNKGTELGPYLEPYLYHMNRKPTLSDINELITALILFNHEVLKSEKRASNFISRELLSAWIKLEKIITTFTKDKKLLQEWEHTLEPRRKTIQQQADQLSQHIVTIFSQDGGDIPEYITPELLETLNAFKQITITEISKLIQKKLLSCLSSSTIDDILLRRLLGCCEASLTILQQSLFKKIADILLGVAYPDSQDEFTQILTMFGSEDATWRAAIVGFSTRTATPEDLRRFLWIQRCNSNQINRDALNNWRLQHANTLSSASCYLEQIFIHWPSQDNVMVDGQVMMIDEDKMFGYLNDLLMAEQIDPTLEQTLLAPVLKAINKCKEIYEPQVPLPYIGLLLVQAETQEAWAENVAKRFIFLYQEKPNWLIDSEGKKLWQTLLDKAVIRTAVSRKFKNYLLSSDSMLRAVVDLEIRDNQLQLIDNFLNDSDRSIIYEKIDEYYIGELVKSLEEKYLESKLERLCRILSRVYPSFPRTEKTGQILLGKFNELLTKLWTPLSRTVIETLSQRSTYPHQYRLLWLRTILENSQFANQYPDPYQELLQPLNISGFDQLILNYSETKIAEVLKFVENFLEKPQANENAWKWLIYFFSQPTQSSHSQALLFNKSCEILKVLCQQRERHAKVKQYLDKQEYPAAVSLVEIIYRVSNILSQDANHYCCDESDKIVLEWLKNKLVEDIDNKQLKVFVQSFRAGFVRYLQQVELLKSLNSLLGKSEIIHKLGLNLTSNCLTKYIAGEEWLLAFETTATLSLVLDTFPTSKKIELRNTLLLFDGTTLPLHSSAALYSLLRLLEGVAVAPDEDKKQLFLAYELAGCLQRPEGQDKQTQLDQIKTKTPSDWVFSSNNYVVSCLPDAQRRDQSSFWTDQLQHLFFGVNVPKSNEILEGARRGKCKWNPEIRRQLFNDKNKLLTNLQVAPNSSQRHVVHRVVLPLIQKRQSAIRFKFDPDLPGMEIAVRSFHRLSLDPTMPFAELMRFPKLYGQRSDDYPVLLSQDVSGERLKEYLHKNSKPRWNKAAYTRRLILALLTNPMDGKPENEIAITSEDGTFEAINIDNDQSFGEPIIQEESLPKLAVMSIIFCFDEMTQALDKKVLAAFLQLNAHTVIDLWLKDIQQQNERFIQMFDADTCHQLFHSDPNNPIQIMIPITTELVTSLYIKFLRMQKIVERKFNDKEGLTGLELMTELNPLLASFYSSLLADVTKSPIDRFAEVGKLVYVITLDEAGRKNFGTSTTARNVMLNIFGKIPDIRSIANQHKVSIADAIKQLNTLKQEYNTLNEVRSELLEGNTAPFLKAPDEFREMVFESTAGEIGKLSDDIQKKIVDALLKCKNFHRLIFQDFRVLSDKDLKIILGNSPQLIYLKLSNCAKISQSVLQNCLRVRFFLEKIVLHKVLTKTTHLSFTTPILEKAIVSTDWISKKMMQLGLLSIIPAVFTEVPIFLSGPYYLLSGMVGIGYLSTALELAGGQLLPEENGLKKHLPNLPNLKRFIIDDLSITQLTLEAPGLERLTIISCPSLLEINCIQSTSLPRVEKRKCAKFVTITINNKQNLVPIIDLDQVEQDIHKAMTTSSSSASSSTIAGDTSSQASLAGKFGTFKAESELPAQAREQSSHAAPFPPSASKANSNDDDDDLDDKNQEYIMREINETTVFNEALHGLQYQQVPGDGHCLFHAVGLHLGEDAAFLRQIVAAHLEANFATFKPYRKSNDKDFRNYIQAIRDGREWGDNIEIDIIQLITNRPIIIIRPNANPTIPDNLAQLRGNPIFIYYNDHNHYDSFVLAGDTDPMDILNRIQEQVRQRKTVIYKPMTQLDENPDKFSFATTRFGMK